jgi:hypothetical protein
MGKKIYTFGSPVYSCTLYSRELLFGSSSELAMRDRKCNYYDLYNIRIFNVTDATIAALYDADMAEYQYIHTSE